MAGRTQRFQYFHYLSREEAISSPMEIADVVQVAHIFGLSRETLTLNGVCYAFDPESGKTLDPVPLLHDPLSPVIVDGEVHSPARGHVPEDKRDNVADLSFFHLFAGLKEKEA